ncbi:MAG TPA: 2-C-methyl-D-erythritol 4-phosphate cytidylyltransferase [Candidatus Eisenbacteria bacterium]|nr:2-C-methyl-D-erythritol 4-phosphate cytidylyltransferase [Candidatus Eisenbacteria bacterium]
MSDRAANAPDLAVILAGAGEGRRMEGRGPKALLEVGGSTLLERVASTFLAHPAVGEIVAVVPERLVAEARSRLDALSNPRGASVTAIAGGATRQESVRLGIGALQRSLSFIAVHDVARALVDSALISRVLEAARETGAAIPALPLRDTVKEVERGRIVRTIPRERLQGAQTPQIFSRDILARAHARSAATDAGATDDAWLVEAAGVPVAVVPGDPSNLKLTEPSDVIAIESHLRAGGAS